MTRTGRPTDHRKDTPEAREIIKLRKSLGLTQEAFAQLVGVDQARISRWECGQEKPSKLARFRLDSIRQRGSK